MTGLVVAVGCGSAENPARGAGGSGHAGELALAGAEPASAGTASEGGATHIGGSSASADAGFGGLNAGASMGGAAGSGGLDSGGTAGAAADANLAGALNAGGFGPSAEVLSHVVGLVTGGAHNCVKLADGRVACWGANDFGQLGDGTMMRGRSTPALVPALSNVISVHAGTAHSCAVLADHQAACWGMNDHGQVGDGTLVNRATPVVVPGLSDVSALAGGIWHTCALRTNGSVECWGDNSQGQLGNGTTTSSAAPTAVTSLSHVVRIGANYDQTCALLDSGKAYCWGLNDFGQMGDGTQFGTRLSPVAVSLSGNAVEIAVGLRHACAVMQDGSAECWGYNSNGALGNGVIDTNVTLIPASVVGLQQSKQIALGSYHSCASLADGGMRCWGYNVFGQVGDGSKIDRGSAALVSGLSGVVEFGLGSQYTCARLTDGTVKCWGLNYDGSLGDGTNTNRPLPVSVVALP